MRYIAFDSDELDIDLSFTLQQLNQVELMWNKGLPLIKIAREIKRKPIEVALLIMDRAEHEKLVPRRQGIYGE